ncbi:hypothetical protein TGVAND_299900 [Toxoplasma gondii VAND]|uniref:Uncharacterized protein n=1 Tax=Toxoplasma gondii VAND TaxID=933077 RepID=A0A086PGY3_TOXGO|nr:hypothetical protein TGVAND_299900 [Toxoplasma gondii VAND]
MAPPVTGLPHSCVNAAIFACRTRRNLPFLLCKKCFFSSENQSCEGLRRANSWCPGRRRAFHERHFFANSKGCCAYPRRRGGPQKRPPARAGEKDLPFLSFFRSGLSQLSAADFPLGEISFVMTADAPAVAPLAEADDAAQASGAPQKQAVREATGFFPSSNEVPPVAHHEFPEAPDPAVMETSLNDLMNEENRAQWLLGTYRADADGLAEAAADKKTQIAVFRATALHRLTRQRWLLKPLRAKVLQNIASFSVEDIASLARFMHQVGYLRTDFLYAASPVIAKNAQLASPATCCLLLDAFAAHRFHPEQAIRALCDQLRVSNLQELGPAQLASLLSSLARLSLRQEVLLAKASDRLLSLWSHSSSGKTPDEIPAALGTATGAVALPRRRETKPKRRYSPHDVAQTVYGLTKLQYTFHPLTECVLRSVLPEVVTRMHSHQLTLAAVAIQRMREQSAVACQFSGRLKCNGRTPAEAEVSCEMQRSSSSEEQGWGLERLQEKAFCLVVDEVGKRLPQFKAESICVVLSACAALGVKDNWLVARLIAQLPRLLLSFYPDDVVVLADALSRLGFHSGATVDLLTLHVRQNSHLYKQRHLQALLSNFSREGIVDSEFLQMYASATDFSRVASPQALISIACALADCGFRNSVVLKNIFNEALPLLPVLSLDDLANVYAAFAVLGAGRDGIGLHEIAEHLTQRLRSGMHNTEKGGFRGEILRIGTSPASSIDSRPDPQTGSTDSAAFAYSVSPQTISLSAALNLSISLLLEEGVGRRRDGRFLEKEKILREKHDDVESLRECGRTLSPDPSLLATDIAVFCLNMRSQSSNDASSGSVAPKQKPSSVFSSFPSVEEQRKLGLLHAALLLRVANGHAQKLDDRLGERVATTMQAVELLASLAPFMARHPAAVPFRIQSTVSCTSPLRVPLRHVHRPLWLGDEGRRFPNGCDFLSSATESQDFLDAYRSVSAASPESSLVAHSAGVKPSEESESELSEVNLKKGCGVYSPVRAQGQNEETRPKGPCPYRHVCFIERSTRSGLAAIQSVLKKFFGISGTVFDCLSDGFLPEASDHVTLARKSGEPDRQEDSESRLSSGGCASGDEERETQSRRDASTNGNKLYWCPENGTGSGSRSMLGHNPYTGYLYLGPAETRKLEVEFESKLENKRERVGTSASSLRFRNRKHRLNGEQSVASTQAALHSDGGTAAPCHQRRHCGVVLLWGDAQHFWHNQITEEGPQEPSRSLNWNPQTAGDRRIDGFTLSVAAAFQLQCFESLFLGVPHHEIAAKLPTQETASDLIRDALEKSRDQTEGESRVRGRTRVVLVPHFIWNAAENDTDRAQFLLESIVNEVKQ